MIHRQQLNANFRVIGKKIRNDEPIKIISKARRTIGVLR